MASVFANAAASLAASLQSAAGISVICRRGSEAVEIDEAVPGQSTFEVQTATGFIEEVRTRDFLIHASRYRFGGRQREPERGDRIDDRSTGALLVFEVMSPSPSDQPFRYCDPGRTILRVHTKQV
jgi:hypothetical protein